MYRRSTTSAAVLSVLALVSSSAVFAQEAEAPAGGEPPFVYVQGQAADVQPTLIEGATRSEGDVMYTDGFTVVETPIEFSDPRLSGVITITMNMLEGAVDGGTAAYVPSHFRIDNDDGYWEGTGTQFWIELEGDDAGGPLATELYTLTGHGSYEGLTTVLWTDFLNDGPPNPSGILFNVQPPGFPGGDVVTTAVD